MTISDESTSVTSQSSDITPPSLTPPHTARRRTVRTPNRRHILFVVLLPLSMSLLQVSSVNVALPVIQESTGASTGQLQWILSGYALAIGLTLAPAGRLGDLIGRSRVFVAGVALFTLACLVCGTVSHPGALNACRLVQGVAAGLYSPQVTGLIQQYFSGQARAKAFSLFGFVVSVSVAAGPLMSGFFIQWLGADVGWRTSFLVNVPIGIAAIIGGVVVLPRGEVQRGSGGKLDLDPLGSILLMFSVLSIMLPFATHGSRAVWLLLPLAVVFGVGWVFWELHYARRGHQPMVDMHLFKLPSLSFNMGIATLQFFGVTSVLVLVALFLQEGLGKAAIIAALVGLPNAIASAFSSLWSAKYALTHGRGMQVLAVIAMVVGIILAGIAVVMVAAGYPVWIISIGVFIEGLGQGVMSATNQTQTMMDIPPAQGSIVGGITQTVQRMATAIGTTVTTGILFRTVQSGDGAALENWSHGMMYSMGAITLEMTIGLAIAVWYWRLGRGSARTSRIVSES